MAGMTFDELWARFLTKIRHVDEGTDKLYEGYGRNHLIPFFGGTDIGLILRTRPLRAADARADALYVNDDWVTGMLKKERRNNAGRPIAGSPLSRKFVDNRTSPPSSTSRTASSGMAWPGSWENLSRAEPLPRDGDRS